MAPSSREALAETAHPFGASVVLRIMARQGSPSTVVSTIDRISTSCFTLMASKLDSSKQPRSLRNLTVTMRSVMRLSRLGRCIENEPVLRYPSAHPRSITKFVFVEILAAQLPGLKR